LDVRLRRVGATSKRPDGAAPDLAPHPYGVYPACPIPAALGQLCAFGHPVAGAGANAGAGGAGAVIPRTCAAVSPPRAGTPVGVGPAGAGACCMGICIGGACIGACIGGTCMGACICATIG
jgi:hypothetical protein